MKQTLLLLFVLICLSANAGRLMPATITMTTAKNLGETIEFSLAATTDNNVVFIDFGDGTMISKTLIYKGASEPISGTLVGSKTVKIYGDNVHFLYCYSQKLTALDVTNNAALEYLNCSSNQLTSIDVTHNTALKELDCNLNQLTSLNVSQNSALTLLWCDSNQLTSIDVTHNTSLLWLGCSINQLSSINLTQNTPLQLLRISYNQLSSIDVAINAALTRLECSNNQISSIDVANNTELEYLDCGENKLSSLNVTQNTALTTLNCFSNQLLSINVTQNTLLKELSCFDNLLSSIDLSHNPELTHLKCYANRLTFATLPISKPTTFMYAPQSSINIANSFTTNTPIDLSSQLIADGNTTTYTWKTQTGTTLTAGIDYTINNGITTFTSVPSEKVYCEMTNATFPNLSGTNVLKTTFTSIYMTATAVEIDKANDFELYARNQTVFLNLPAAAEVQVYDITGHQIKTEYYNSGNNSFEVAQKGIYVIKVNINNQVVAKKVVIK